MTINAMTHADWMFHPDRPCATRNPEDWFPTEHREKAAKKLCDGCPVRTACLDDALANRIDYGIWGGLTPRERRQIIRRNDPNWRAVERAAGVA